MQQVQGGKFCTHCQHKVIDFTAVSDTALLAHIARNGAACGRFRTDQLNHAITPPTQPERNYWKGLAAGIAAIIAFGKTDTAKAEIRTVFVETDLTKKALLPKAPVSIDTFTIQGIVTDNSGPVISASILIIGSGASTVTDLDGNYAIRIAGYRNQNISIKCQYLGSTEIVTDIILSKQTISCNIVIHHNAAPSLLGMMVIRRRHKSFFQKLQFWYRRRHH